MSAMDDAHKWLHDTFLGDYDDRLNEHHKEMRRSGKRYLSLASGACARPVPYLAGQG